MAKGKGSKGKGKGSVDDEEEMLAIVLAGAGDEDDVPASALLIEPSNIKQEFVHLPGYFATYGERAAEALREQLHAKNNLKRTEARLFVALKGESDSMKEAEGKTRGAGYSEKQIEAMVQTHPEMALAQDRLVRAEFAKAKAYSVMEALRAKRDGLVSITGHVRDERRALGLSGAMDEDDA